MRTLWMAVLGLLVFAAHNGCTEAEQPRAVFARASSQTSASPNIAAPSTSAPTDNGSIASDSRQSSAPATPASSAASGSSSKAPSATTTESLSTSSRLQTSTSAPTASTTTALNINSSASSTNPAPSATSNPLPDDLPITPRITPALSVAGAFLMLTGLFYTLMGIKTKWLHTFLSATYLVGLAVTVLIVYVMHPPVTDAVQGAFFVAAVATGLVFGGGSMIFADLTEGLACLLGGFCLSMWFLVLRADGLIRSTIGKVVFIVCFTLCAYALYISHYTRPYGLIGSISFAGATAIVLGIDCFSRAGLKEFWLYIWNLNDALFPPRYNGPYPITRGIRVEIAAMVLLCLLGVVSQLKAWKLVKNHRDRKAAARMDEEKRQSQAEFDIGRDLEDGNREDRAAWEAVYGQSNGKARQADSGVGTGSTVTPNRASTSVHEADVIISGEKKPAGNSDEKPHLPPKVTVRVASEDSIYEMPSRSVENLLSDGIEDRAESASGRRVDPSKQLTTHPNNSAIDGEEFQTETHMETPFSPPIVPLPFTIPMEEPQQMDDRSSVATFAETDHLPNRMSRKLSVSSLFQRLSTRSKRRSPVSVAAEGESMMSYNDDRASSIAATMDVGDGLLSEAGTPDLERQTPPLDIADETASSKPPRSVDTPLLTLENLNVGHLPTTETPTNNQGPTDHITDADHATQDRDQNSPVQGPNGAKTEDRLTPESRQDLEVNSIAASGTSEKRAVPASLRDQLPEGPPGIVMTYRTNEWAKHLGQADAPPPESLRRVSSSARSSPIMTEGAAPVNVHELTQTPLNAWPLPMKIDTKLDRSATSSRDSLPSQQHHQPPLPQKSSLRGSSYGKSINRTSSQTSLEQPRASRRSSAPLVNAPFVDSPIEEDVETSFPQRGNRSYTPTNTLMAKRNNKLQTRYSSTSLARTGSSGSSGSSNNGYIPANQVIENPTAAHRKSLLQRQYSRSPRPRNTPRTSASYSPYQTDSGPTSPVENNTSIASAWRSSLRNDASAERLSDQQMEARRNELLSQKRRASAGAQAAGAERMRRESQQDLGVRKGDLLERHKEAMRRMQAGVAL